MTDENAIKNTNDTTAANLPPAPNGHGASNGTTSETPQAGTTAEGVSKDTPSASASKKKKKKKKGRHQHDQKQASAQVESTVATADQPVPTEPAEPAEPTEPTEPIDPQPPIEEPTTATIEERIAEPIAAAPIEAHAAAPVKISSESLRLRMKVWTDHTTAKRYLIPSAFMRDLVNGQPMSDVMFAYAMCDDDTKLVTLTASEWNALPFFYFQEDGPAPRATTRPVDVIYAHEGSHEKTS